MRLFNLRPLRLASTVAVTALAIGIAAPGALAQNGAQNPGLSPAAERSLSDFGACLSANRQADILFVLDESGSLTGSGTDTATDPDHLRVDATRDLVKQFEVLANDLNADIDIKLAGFGREYRSDPATYGDWIPVAEGAEVLDDPITGFRDRANDSFTSYGVAFDGMLSEFARHSDSGSCKATLFFTDGLLTVEGSAEDDLAARQAVCSPGSQIGDLRRAGISLFSVGLMPQGSDTPEELLRRISEDDTCVPGTTANGAFFNAGTDPAALFSAFRNIIPSPGGVESVQDLQSPFSFILDNSIDPVRISGQPTSKFAEGAITPTLTSPQGETIDLTEGTHTLGDTTVSVTTVEGLPGMFDGTMELSDNGDWAGEWIFSYRTADNIEGAYEASIQIAPGLSLVVAELTDGGDTGLSSADSLTVSLQDSEGDTRAVAGAAELTAQLTDATGAVYDLGPAQSISSGSAVIPLDSLDRPVTGDLTLTANITTQGVDNTPGTTLSPITATYPVTVTPVNMPRIPGSINADLESTETTLTVPVTGPGAVWIEEGELAGEQSVLPTGVDSLGLTSPHNSPDTALQLAEGETGSLELTLTANELADGPVVVNPTLHLISAEGDTDEAVTIPLDGSMRAPVSASAFSLALIIALLLALLIPLGLLYLMKYVSGTIPRKPGVHAIAIPVTISNGRLLRRDTGGDFTADFDEVVLGTPRVTSSGRSINLAGHQVQVAMGPNPFTPAQAVVQSSPSVAADGSEKNGQAVLPLAVHNQWFAVGAPGGSVQSADQGTIVLAVDEFTSREQFRNLIRDINSRGEDRLRKALASAPDMPSSGGGVNPASTSAPTGHDGTGWDGPASNASAPPAGWSDAGGDSAPGWGAPEPGAGNPYRNPPAP